MANAAQLPGFLPVALAVPVGGGLGVIAGYFGRLIGTVIMRALDIVYSFPAILLAIGISASLRPGISSNIIISATVVFIPPIARIAETAVKEVRKEEIEAAVSSGAGSALTIRLHVLKIGICLMLASGLSFLVRELLAVRSGVSLAAGRGGILSMGA